MPRLPLIIGILAIFIRLKENMIRAYGLTIPRHPLGADNRGPIQQVEAVGEVRMLAALDDFHVELFAKVVHVLVDEKLQLSIVGASGRNSFQP